MRTILLFTLILLPVRAATQITQWRGPERNGHFPDSGLMKIWPVEGPTKLFEVTGIGEGFSSPLRHNGWIYVTGKKDTMDWVSAIDEEGEIQWQVPYGRSWVRSYPNSRSTPTLEDDRMYLISGTGRLVCMHARTAEVIWAVDVDEEFEAEWHRWGVSESPLLVDDIVVCTPAGKRTTMVAFDKMNGTMLWESEASGGLRSYVSPVLYEEGPVRLILGFTSRNVFAVNPETGELVWDYAYHKLGKGSGERGAIMTNTPLYRDGEIFITTGYDYPAVMLTLSADGQHVTEKWRSPTLDNHHGHVVRVGDHLYGANWYSNRDGKWVCMHWDNAEVRWVERWYTKGSIITADGMLIIMDEREGNVGLLEADPEEFRLLGSFQIEGGRGPYWAHPSVDQGALLIRHGDHLFVYDIREQ